MSSCPASIVETRVIDVQIGYDNKTTGNYVGIQESARKIRIKNERAREREKEIGTNRRKKG